MRIGLTGGIASGKSSVAKILEERGIPVVDADEVSRAVVQRGSPLFHAIVEAFGHGVLNSTGDLDRAALGELVFNDPEARSRLNALMHPAIWAEMQRQTEQLEQEHPVVVVMVPLLLENRREDWVDQVWLVHVPPEVQKARLMARNSLTERQALARIAAQMPLSEKLALADVVIDNAGAPEQTRAQVEEVLAKL